MSDNIFDRIKSGEKIGTLILENSIKEYVLQKMKEEQREKINEICSLTGKFVIFQ